MTDTEKYNTGFKRLGASLVDWIVFLPLLLIQQWLYKTTKQTMVLFIWETIMLLLPLLYSIILHHKKGQTIGKWVAGVQVLDVGETRKISLLQSIYRDGFYAILALIGIVYYGYMLTSSENPEATLTEYSGFTNNPLFWWMVLELVTMLMNPKRRAIHDLIAKSVVVKTTSS